MDEDEWGLLGILGSVGGAASCFVDALDIGPEEEGCIECIGGTDSCVTW